MMQVVIRRSICGFQKHKRAGSYITPAVWCLTATRARLSETSELQNQALHSSALTPACVCEEKESSRVCSQSSSFFKLPALFLWQSLERLMESGHYEKARAGRLQRRAISKIEKPLTSKECSWWEQFFLLSDQSWQKTSLTLRCWPRTQHWNSNVWGHTLSYCTPFHHLFPTCAVKYCRSRARKMFCNILCRRVDENSVNIPLIVSRSHLSWNEELHFWMCSRLTRV